MNVDNFTAHDTHAVNINLQIASIFAALIISLPSFVVQFLIKTGKICLDHQLARYPSSLPIVTMKAPKNGPPSVCISKRDAQTSSQNLSKSSFPFGIYEHFIGWVLCAVLAHHIFNDFFVQKFLTTDSIISSSELSIFESTRAIFELFVPIIISVLILNVPCLLFSLITCVTFLLTGSVLIQIPNFFHHFNIMFSLSSEPLLFNLMLLGTLFYVQHKRQISELSPKQIYLFAFVQTFVPLVLGAINLISLNIQHQLPTMISRKLVLMIISIIQAFLFVSLLARSAKLNRN